MQGSIWKESQRSFDVYKNITVTSEFFLWDLLN